MTLTRSKVKVKVTGLLNFRKLAKPCMLAAITVSPFVWLSGSIYVSVGIPERLRGELLMIQRYTNRQGWARDVNGETETKH